MGHTKLILSKEEYPWCVATVKQVGNHRIDAESQSVLADSDELTLFCGKFILNGTELLQSGYEILDDLPFVRPPPILRCDSFVIRHQSEFAAAAVQTEAEGIPITQAPPVSLTRFTALLRCTGESTFLSHCGLDARF